MPTWNLNAIDLKAHEIHRCSDLHLWRNLLGQRLRGLLLAFWATELGMGHNLSRKHPSTYRVHPSSAQQVNATVLSKVAHRELAVDPLTALHQ